MYNSVMRSSGDPATSNASEAMQQRMPSQRKRSKASYDEEYMDADEVDEFQDKKGKKGKAAVRKSSLKGRSSSGAAYLVNAMETQEDMDLVEGQRARALSAESTEIKALASAMALGPQRCHSFTSDASIVGAWMDATSVSEFILSFRHPLLPDAPPVSALDLLHGSAYPLAAPRAFVRVLRSVLKVTLQLWAQVSGHSSRLAHRTRRWLRMMSRGQAWQEVLRRWLLISRVGMSTSDEELALPPHLMSDVAATAACAVELGKVQIHQIDPRLILKTLRVLTTDLLDTNAFGAEMLGREMAVEEQDIKKKAKQGTILAQDVALMTLEADEQIMMRRHLVEKEARKSLIRSEPLGCDRHQRVYYHLTSTGGLILVEEPGEKGLGVITSIGELNSIISSLNPQGNRESALLACLSSQYDALCTSLERLSVPCSEPESQGTTILQAMLPCSPSSLPQKMLSSVIQASKECLALPPATVAAAEAEAAVAEAEAAAIGRNCKGKAAAVQLARAAAEAAKLAAGDETYYYQGPERRFKDLFAVKEEEMEEGEGEEDDGEDDDDESMDPKNGKIDMRTKEGRELKKKMQEMGVWPEVESSDAAEPKIDMRTKEGRELKKKMQEEEEQEARKQEARRKAAEIEKKLELERDMDLGSLLERDASLGLSVATKELSWLAGRLKVVKEDSKGESWRDWIKTIHDIQSLLKVLLDVEAELQSLADGQPEAASNEDLAPLVKEAEDFDTEFVLPPAEEDEEDEEISPEKQRKLVTELEELDDSETEERQREKMDRAAVIGLELANGTDPLLLQPKPRMGLWRTRRDRAVWLRDLRRCQMSGLVTHSLYVCGLLVDRAEVLIAGMVVDKQEKEKEKERRAMFNTSVLPSAFIKQPMYQPVPEAAGGDGEGNDGGGRGKRAASSGVTALIAKVGSRKLKQAAAEKEAMDLQ